MESVREISNKIIKCSHIDKLEILISVRAFLFDNPEISGLVFDDFSKYNEVLEVNKNKSNKIIKFQNEKNIKKIGIKSQDLLLLPRNKKNSLIQLVDSMIDEYNCVIVFDKIKADPFLSDDLHLFIKINKEYFSSDNVLLYDKRSKELINIIEYAQIDNQIYENCFTTSRKNKIKNYWINIWGLSENYLNPGVIENLLL